MSQNRNGRICNCQLAALEETCFCFRHGSHKIIPVMRTATINISDLYAFLGQEEPAVRPDAGVVIAMAEHQFAFLPQSLQIEVNGSVVTVTFPAVSDSAQTKTARLADRAAQRVSAGKRKKAVSIYKRVLELHPTLHQARRDLAMNCLSTGDHDAFCNHLIDGLRLKPDDAWTWDLLGHM